MYYVNFDQHITLKFGVVLENWPLTRFAVPGSFSAIPILSLLYNTFESGATCFRSLTNDEWFEWLTAFKAGQAPPSVTSSAILTVEEENLSAALASEALVDSCAPAMSQPAPDSIPSVSASSTEEVALPTSVTNSDGNLAPSDGSVAAASPASPPSTPEVNLADTPDMQLTVACGQKRPFQQVGGCSCFINNFVSTDGTGIVQVTKKPRKLRSDAGKKRGPRNKNAAAAQPSAPATPNTTSTMLTPAMPIATAPAMPVVTTPAMPAATVPAASSSASAALGLTASTSSGSATAATA